MLKQKTPGLCHALISVAGTAVLVFTGVAGFGAEPQIPLIFGCFLAGLVAYWLGYSWTEILDGIISGITQSIEAVLVLMMIGVLVGTWICSGTVPALIYYGLRLISPKYFLVTSVLLCGFVSFVIGAWGTVGTVGLAFMGIGRALGIPAPMIAGGIITGAYFGEIVSPLSDATNLTAAVTGCNVFKLMKKTVPIALAAFTAAEILYFIAGLRYGGNEAPEVVAHTDLLLKNLSDSFQISPLAFLPIISMIVCVIIKLPAIPSMLCGSVVGAAMAMLTQGVGLNDWYAICFSGYASSTGEELLDSLLTAGGLESMMGTISIIIIAMGFGGVMQSTGQINALTAPVVRRLRRKGGPGMAVALFCIGVNVILPDQYLGISVPGQMFVHEYDRREIPRPNLSRTLLCSGAVTSPLIVWNTCGIYCAEILQVGVLEYLPYAYLSILLPVLTVVADFWGVPSSSRQIR